MSCLPEYRYSIYLDGELEGEGLREVEAHLVSCRRCRALVVALREEAELLGDVLQDHLPETPRRVAGRARAHGMAVGLLPALGVVALVVTIGGWLIDLDGPSGLGWLSPLNFIGAYEMVFDMVFVVRDRAPAFFDLTIAVGVMASVAAVATFLAGALVRTLGRGLTPIVVLLAFGMTLSSAAPAAALELRVDEPDIRIAPGEVIDETLVASGDTVTIEGVVEGDLVVLAERFSLTGRVSGNLYAAAREVDLRGEVGGSAHLGGERVSVEGEIARSLYGAAETLTLRDTSRVGWDVLLFGEHVRAEGRAGRDLGVIGERVELRGTVDRNATTRSAELVVHEGARIGGNLDVELEEGEEPRIAEGAQVGGELLVGVLDHDLPHRGSRFTDPHFYLRVFVFLVSAFLVGMALQMVIPGLFMAELETPAEFFRCMGFGFVALVMTPIFLLLCLITVVGIPIGVIGGFLYLTTLFVSVIVVAALVGAALLGRDGGGSYSFGLSLLLGLVVVLIAANLPVIGVLLRVLVLLTGLGLLLTSTFETWQRARAALRA